MLVATDRMFNAFTVFRAAKDRRGAGKNSGTGPYPGFLSTPPTPEDEARTNFSYVWSGLSQDETRYSDGSFPVLYTGGKKTTTYREVGYHLHNNYAAEIKARGGQNIAHIIYNVRLKGLGRDFGLGKDARKLLCQPKKKGGYKVCCDVSEDAKGAGIGFLRVPSARCDHAENYPIFNQANCQEPQQAQEVVLILTGNKREVTVKTEVQKRSYAIKRS